MRFLMTTSAVALSLLLGFGTPSVAELTVVETYEEHIDLTDTPWMQLLEIPQYNPEDHDGMALAQVCVHLELTVEGDVTFNGADTTVLGADAGGTAELTGPGGIDETVIASQVIAPPQIILVDGQPVVMDIDTSDMAWYEYDSEAVLAASTGDGDVEYEVAADGSLSLQIVGGNINVGQDTAVGAWLKVEYKVVPEPGTLGLLFLGAGGVAGMAWRRR